MSAKYYTNTDIFPDQTRTNKTQITDHRSCGLSIKVQRLPVQFLTIFNKFTWTH